MTTFESALYYANPGQERLRLWQKENKHEIELEFKDMQRDIDAELGQSIRKIIQAPHEHQAIVRLCQAADKKVAELAMVLNEGVEAEADRLRTTFMHAALTHPGESDPTEEVRERIKSNPQTEAPYCSPILVETLLWEGTNELPNTHRKKLELDFPARVEALLEFHCIAFHSDVDVLKELYDEDVLGNKEKKREILGRHRAKMEALMASFAGDMTKQWDEEKERLRLRATQSSVAESPVWWGANDWMINQLPAPDSRVDGGRRRAHMTDSPTILRAAAERRPKTAQSLPLRGILKKTSTPASGVPNRPPLSNKTVAVESLTFDDDDEEDETEIPGSFFLGELETIDGGKIGEESKPSRQYLEPEIVVDSPNHQQLYASTSRSYEIYRPQSTSDDLAGKTPRAAGNGERLTRRFEERTDKGKGKAKSMN